MHNFLPGSAHPPISPARRPGSLETRKAYQRQLPTFKQPTELLKSADRALCFAQIPVSSIYLSWCGKLHHPSLSSVAGCPADFASSSPRSTQHGRAATETSKRSLGHAICLPACLEPNTPLHPRSHGVSKYRPSCTCARYLLGNPIWRSSHRNYCRHYRPGHVCPVIFDVAGSKRPLVVARSQTATTSGLVQLTQPALIVESEELSARSSQIPQLPAASRASARYIPSSAHFQRQTFQRPSGIVASPDIRKICWALNHA